MVIPDKIIRSRRKTVALQIDESGRLIVRAPLVCSDKRIADFIRAKEKWIVTKKAEAKQGMSAHSLVLQSGARVEILGMTYTLDIGDYSRTSQSGGVIKLPKTETKNKFVRWVATMLRNYIASSINGFARQLGVEYKSVTINSAHTRWGSCGANGSLNFCFRLAFCPLEVVDYVIVHELSHIREHNHSARFWTVVGSVVPNYKECEQYLKLNRAIMYMV